MAREQEPMENLKKYRKSGLEHFIKFVRELPVIPPKKIFTKLEEAGYRGQDEARRAVSLMAYRHVKRIKRIYLDGAKREQVLPKSNFLLDRARPAAARPTWSSCCSRTSCGCRR